MTTKLTETFDREISICARPDTVFRFFTDSDRFARWWGTGSRIDPRPGGEVFIQYPNGVTSKGRIVEIEAPKRIVFTYGYGGSGVSDDSLVTITLGETEQGTLLKLHHAFTSAKIRDHFVQGWRHQLALFSKAVADEGQKNVLEKVDAYLRAWGDPDAQIRRQLMESCAAPEIVFRDAFSLTMGLEDMLANLEAVQTFMPGVRMERDGDVQLSHGTAITRWRAVKEDGAALGHGTNIYDFSPDGRIARVVGFWQT